MDEVWTECDTWDGPAILLVDLDAFFASVEQLDHPAWRGKPVIVGGNPDKHGVVSTCSYEARAFGVRSAMPSSMAARLCPEAIWTPGHHDRYREMSSRIMDILRDESPFVQQVSIDEAFVDVSPNAVNREHPVRIASRIQSRVASLGVTCSIGIGTSKTVAKIASDRDKPRGLVAVYPGRERAFLAPLPVRALSGIGEASERKLVALGIRTLGDIASADPALLTREFGKNGATMYIRACGKDDAPIETEDETKSVSNEMTFAEDLVDRDDIEAAIATMAAKACRRMRGKGLKGSTVSLKIRYDDRTSRSVQRSLAVASDNEHEVLPKLAEMLDDVWRPGMSVRLLGVGFSHFGETAETQLSLFDANEALEASEHGANEAKKARQRNLAAATDLVRDRFGESAVRFGREMRNERNTTGTASKNPADYK